jgi:hypothetical protein
MGFERLGQNEPQWKMIKIDEGKATEMRGKSEKKIELEMKGGEEHKVVC